MFAAVLPALLASDILAMRIRYRTHISVRFADDLEAAPGISNPLIA